MSPRPATAPAPPLPPDVDPGTADGAEALRLLVVVGLVVDAVTTFADLGLSDAGWSAAALTTCQLGLAIAAAAAVMWGRTRLAVVLSALVLVLALTVGPTSAELWLLAVVAVTVATRAAPRVVVAVAAAQLAYVLLFALDVERRSPGYGTQAAAVAGVVCLFGFGAGLLVRRSLRLLLRRRRRLEELERESVQIRATERLRLADDLQTVVTGGLAAIRRELESLAGRTDDAAALRRGLSTIDQVCRLVLSELRSLLEILRRDAEPAEQSEVATGPAPRRWVAVLTARHVRLAAAAALGLLAVRAALTSGDSRSTSATIVELLGWAACAAALLSVRTGAAVAAAAVVVSLATGTATDWRALPTVVLFFLAARHAGLRRLWLVLAALLAYGALVVATVPDWALPLTTTGYAAVLAIIAGLGAGHFLDAERGSARQHARLLDDRNRLEGQERAAVARDLHDVVAHQLSLTTLSIMGSSASTDPAVLAATLRLITENVAAADSELVALLHAMRGSASDHVQSTPLVLPSTGAERFARHLSASGFHPVIEVDRSADDLDATTMRTLGRIMQEATTNIVRYAPAGSACRYALDVAEDRVRLTVLSSMPVQDRRSMLSLGWGLRGIAERVALSHGSFTAGPRRGDWLVDVTLPLDRTDARPAAALAG